MTDPSSFSRLATDRLRRSDDAPLPPPSAAARDQAIALLGAAIAEQAQRRRRKKMLGIAAVAIAASLVATVSVKLLHRAPAPTKEAVRLVAHPSGPASVVHGGVVAPMSMSATLVDGDRVRTESESHASVVLSTGTQIEIDSASELGVTSSSTVQSFVAAAGGSKFSVAKLAPGERFLVHTDDTEVEVHGTIFRVSVAKTECKGTRTRVEVTEGTVVVRHHGDEVRLGASDRWPNGCFDLVVPPAPVAPAPAVIEEPAPAKIVAPVKTGAQAPAASAPITPSSELAAQNDLFAEGIAKKRAGDKIGAALVFERFLTRWPTSSLAESAAVERMRLLSGDPARAAAKDYLARFPKGAARAEAESVAH